MRRHISRIGCGARGFAHVAAPSVAESLHNGTSHSMSNGGASGRRGPLQYVSTATTPSCSTLGATRWK